MNRLLFVFLFLLVNIPLWGQSLALVKSTPLLNEAVSVSIDKVSNIYIADKKGDITQYDKGGNLLLSYSPQKPGKIKSIEASATLNILLFYEGLQEYRFLDRFLTLSSSKSLKQDIFARLATPSADNNLWIFDDKAYSLQKINISYDEPEITVSLTNVIDQSFQGNFLKEYQNLVFLSDINSGIYVFDNLGNYIKKLPLPGATYFNFYKDELYFLSENSLIFYNIYNAEKRIVPLPQQGQYLFGLATEHEVYLISKNNLEVYQVL